MRAPTTSVAEATTSLGGPRLRGRRWLNFTPRGTLLPLCCLVLLLASCLQRVMADGDTAGASPEHQADEHHAEERATSIAAHLGDTASGLSLTVTAAGSPGLANVTAIGEAAIAATLATMPPPPPMAPSPPKVDAIHADGSEAHAPDHAGNELAVPLREIRPKAANPAEDDLDEDEDAAAEIAKEVDAHHLANRDTGSDPAADTSHPADAAALPPPRPATQRAPRSRRPVSPPPSRKDARSRAHLRNTARTLLRRLAAERVAQAKQAVAAALKRKRLAQATTEAATEPTLEPPNTKQQDLFPVDHSHDDEIDDDLGRDKALLKYAMDQMAEASRKKGDEVAQLLAALKEDHVDKGEVDLAELKKLQHLQRATSYADHDAVSSVNYTPYILLGIGLLVLCIAIPVVWIYWLRTWMVQNVGGGASRQYRSINGASSEVQTATDEDAILLYDEDEDEELSTEDRAHRSMRFDSRGKKNPRAVVKKSPKQSRAAAAAAAAAARKAARNLPDFDPHAHDSDDDRSRRKSSYRAPQGPRPRIEDLSEDEDFSEEAGMISGSGAGRAPRY